MSWSPYKELPEPHLGLGGRDGQALALWAGSPLPDILVAQKINIMVTTILLNVNDINAIGEIRLIDYLIV